MDYSDRDVLSIFVVALARDSSIFNLTTEELKTRFVDDSEYKQLSFGYFKRVLNTNYDDIDTEDKDSYVDSGFKKELIFLIALYKNLFYGIRINPKKLFFDNTSMDFQIKGEFFGQEDRVPADYKHRATPLDTAGRYGLSRRNAVTFNKNKLNMYEEKYGDRFRLLVNVDYQPGIYNNHEFHSIHQGIYVVDPQRLDEEIKEAKDIDYLRRTNDTRGNARSSYVLDITKFPKIQEVIPDVDWSKIINEVSIATRSKT